MERFSWKRVGMLWHYMYPAVRFQIIWYPVLSLVAALFGTLVLSVSTDLLVLADVPTTLMGLLVFLAPVALIKHDYHHTTALLPVTAAEKFTVLVLYFVFGVFALVNVPYYVVCGLAWCFNPDLFSSLLSLIGNYFNGIGYLWIMIGSYPINFALIGIVLLSIVGSKRPTVSRSVLYLVISYVIYVVIVGCAAVIAAIIAVFNNYSDGTFQAAASASDHTEYVAGMIAEMVVPTVSLSCLVLGVTAIIIVYRMIYKRLKIGGF